MVDRGVIENIAKALSEGQYINPRERELAGKILMAFAQLYVEHTGAMFICGTIGQFDTGGLPDGVLICPAYGADYIQSYMRSDK